jgi:hypothetical protein
VLEFMAWMEASALGQAMRSSGVWAYAVVNLLHILGIATLFGAVLLLDLRLLGLWRRVPLEALAAAAVPVAACGLALAMTTGAGLLATRATEYYGNPFLAIKFPAMGAALLNVLLLTRSTAWRARGARELTSGEHRRLKIGAAISLACWLTTITAGRLIAYW